MTHDKVSYFHAELIFEPFRSEVSLVIPAFNKRNIIEGHFALQTCLDSPPKHVGTISPYGAEDVHVYFDDVDVTLYYVKVLSTLLDKLDQKELAMAYASAMDGFIAYAEALGQAYDGLIPSLRKDAAKLAGTKPLSSLVAKIGNRNHGHHGHLHLCNFLYGQIPCPEVPMTGVANLYNADHPKAMIDPALIQRVTFSCGPSPTLDFSGWKKQGISPGGAALITVAVQLHDTLEDVVVELQRQLRQMQEDITSALDSIQDSLGPNGTIRRTIAQTGTTADQALVAVKAARSDIQSTDAQIGAQTQTLSQIKTQVDAL
mgnify:CR=1 FL=1